MRTKMKEKEWEQLKEYREREKLKGQTEGTVKRKIRIVERFINYLEEKKIDKTLGEITIKEVRKFVKEISERPGKEQDPRDYNLKMTHINQFFNYLLENGKILQNPMIRFERKRLSELKEVEIFTEEEIKKIIENIPATVTGQRDRAMIELLYSTGMRLGELTNLDLDDIDFKTREVMIRSGKGGRDRIIPVGEEALKSLKEYLKIRYRFLFLEREKESLFLGTRGNRINKEVVRERFCNWKRKAGVEREGAIQKLRHTFASHLLKRGAPMQMVQKMLGHKRLRTTQIYTHMKEKELEQAYKDSHPKGRKSK